jgi:hypothetical protein
LASGAFNSLIGFNKLLSNETKGLFFEIGVFETVVSQSMPLIDNALNQVGVLLGPFTHHKKSRFDIVLSQNLQDLRGCVRRGTIVKCQSHKIVLPPAGQ